MRDNANGGSSTSVEKALDILLCFSPEEPELGVSEIARRLGMGISTAHRLLQLMIGKDFVRQNPSTSRYSLGFRVVHLASTVVARSSIRAASLSHMLELRDATGESVRLHLLSGREQVCIEEVESPQAVRAARMLGRGTSLYASTEGRVMLAFLPALEARHIVAEAQRLGAVETDGVAALNDQLERIRERGFALSSPAHPADSNGLAVPVRNFTGAVIGALSVDGPPKRWTEALKLSFAREVVDRGYTISRQLGFVAQPAPERANPAPRKSARR